MMILDSGLLFWATLYISSVMKIGRGVLELWRVENRPLPLTWPLAYTTACTTVQAVILGLTLPVKFVT